MTGDFEIMNKKDSLDVDAIEANLKTKLIGKKIIVYKSTSSTNDIAAEYARNKDNVSTVIFSERQSVGRGRWANKWFSKKGDSILCSIVYADGKNDLDLVSLSSAVAVAEAVGKCGKSQAKIKWPNDIIINGKKIAGILVEAKTYKNRKAYIIGIGINCHTTKDAFPTEIKDIATSIDIESGGFCDRIALAKRLLISLDKWLDIAATDSDKLIKRWCKKSIQLGHRVTLLHNRKKYTGNCIGIDPQKGLIIQLDSGAVQMFDAAHTSIEK